MFPFGIRVEHSSDSVTLARLCGLTSSHIRPKFRAEYLESVMTSRQEDSEEKSQSLINLMETVKPPPKKFLLTFLQFCKICNKPNLKYSNMRWFQCTQTTVCVVNKITFGMFQYASSTKSSTSKNFLHCQIYDSLNFLSYFLLCNHALFTAGNRTCLACWQ